jgi:hypothetical protein
MKLFQPDHETRAVPSLPKQLSSSVLAILERRYVFG